MEKKFLILVEAQSVWIIEYYYSGITVFGADIPMIIFERTNQNL